MPDNVRLDKRTETGVLVTCDTDTDKEAWYTVIYGEPSTPNQASIRRLYISFKQMLKQKTSKTDPRDSVLTVFFIYEDFNEVTIFSQKKKC